MQHGAGGTGRPAFVLLEDGAWFPGRLMGGSPGALGEVARRLADAHVNIDLAYTTFGGVRLVFCTDDVRVAREALDT